MKAKEIYLTCSKCRGQIIGYQRRTTRLDPIYCIDCKIAKEESNKDSRLWGLIKDRLWHLSLDKYKHLQPYEVKGIY